MAYAYTPAFIAFCGGAPPEEIAAEFKIPLNSLLAKIRQEGWRTLANKMAGRLTIEITPNAKALEKLESNRAINYETAVKLRDDLVLIIEHLRAGTLRIKRQWHYRGKVVEYEAEPTIADRVNIATYARTIMDLTYRALGDHGANGGHTPDAAAGAPPPAPPINIVLPAAIARPRSERTLPEDQYAPKALGYPGPDADEILS